MRVDRDPGVVLLPFAADALPSIPPAIDYELYDTGAEPPARLADVALYVLPYQADTRDLDLMSRMPRLSAVQTLTAGVDHVWPHLPPGVDLHNGRGIHDASTAELAVALILAGLRGIPDFVLAQQEGRWESARYRSLADRTVLIVGYGSIGAALEARLAPFETTVLRVARSERPGVHGRERLPELLGRADVVVMTLPATADSAGMVDAGFLEAMRPGALLVNVARGSIVDTAALMEALLAGTISAALDVTDPEPLPPDHPLWSCPNLLISPHVGGNTTAMTPRATRLVAEQLARWAARQPLANRIMCES